MVCRFIDSFDYYATSDMNRKYTSVGANSINTDSRTGPNSNSYTNVSQFLNKGFSSLASWVVGFAFKTSTLNGLILRFLDNSTVQVGLFLRNDGSLDVLRTGSTAVAGGRSDPIIRIDNWYYIEMKVTIANSIAANSCIVRVNEKVMLIVDAGEDLQQTTNATANVIQTPGLVPSVLDDLYIFDQTDGPGTNPVNNDFAGDVKVTAHWPNGNGTTNNFVGSDGNSVDNYLLVDEALTDDDSTYTESSTPGEIDLYTFDDLATTPDVIHAVQINGIMRKTDAGSRTVRTVIRPASTNFFGINRAPSVASYINEEEIYDEDPETGLAWTESGFNATEFGIEIET